MVEQFLQSHRQGIESLAGSRHPLHDDQRRLVRRLHQRFLEEILPRVSGSDPVRRTFSVFQFPYHAVLHPSELRLLRRLVCLQDDKLILFKLWHKTFPLPVKHIDLICRDAFLLKILEQLFRNIHLTPSTVLVFMFQYLIRSKVLCTDPQDLRLDAEEDVFGHKNDLLLPGLRKTKTDF